MTTVKRCVLSGTDVCPLPIAEDRFDEALHFMEALEADYHDPRLFRFNLNALLAAMRSSVELLNKEMEQLGRGTSWKPTKELYRDDPDLSRIAQTRNRTLHQKAIFDGSEVSIGLFRGRRMKLALIGDNKSDQTSQELLLRWQASKAGALFLDDDRDAIGEQYGVWRRYFVKSLSETDDALVACWKAFIRTNDMLNDAHRLCGSIPYEVPAEELLSDRVISKVTVLLESDVDPSLIEKWEW